MFPAEVFELTYAGWSDCWLRSVGEKPLWKSLPDRRFRQQIRFTFMDGHFRYARVINFKELSDGTGRIELKTLIPSAVKRAEIENRSSRKVSANDVRRLNALAASADVWKFETGTWDGNEMYLHCETLDMERMDPTGYRFSSISISCNRPRMIEPLLEFVTSLAGLKGDGAAY